MFDFLMSCNPFIFYSLVVLAFIGSAVLGFVIGTLLISFITGMPIGTMIALRWLD